ncbi:hypothetical protein [Sinorhizobium psoraleae]|uniref:Uncharacterized protein n=1 Tax=Sinorhizobium psoraleae TaxID=520838 RepID=A0ABT4KBJ1_9HYPH|nr:hypothetical protein [Sinorhizobium psoraleae]MCZ4089345.1 hypothetical protein [Sinorhizobium psoraleae]
MKYELFRIDSHPLAAKFYELMVEIEKLPGDPRQTDLVCALQQLKQQTQDLMNDPGFQAKMARADGPPVPSGPWSHNPVG